MNIITRSVEIGGRTITFETGKLAKQASGAVVVSSGDSQVLVTVVVAQNNQPFDFLPLTVDYMDRNGASGTIPGGYLKREGRGSERETLISRLIDRPIRPMFPKHFRMEMQCIAMVMSFDRDNDTDVLALCGAACAFGVSPAPISDLVAAVRICRIDGKFQVNPGYEARERADINLVIAGTSTAILMVEGGATAAKEADMLDALDLAQGEIAKLIACMKEVVAAAGVAKIDAGPGPQLDETVTDFVTSKGTKKLAKAIAIGGKHERRDALKAVRDDVIETLVKDKSDAEKLVATGQAKEVWEKLVKKAMRRQVIEDDRRLDGRKPADIRAIWCEVGVGARAHGSAIFTRGETQTYVTLALGTDDDVQREETPQGRTERRFMLSYNFPPFCTGEARRLGAPRRREVGHAALARRSLMSVLPSKESFPYVLRSTSEVLESNGSSSMATVCGTTLALMDAGVPIAAPVAGIAMGLIAEGEKFAVLSDILGDEDHLGDMDFKVCGTREGITGFQMDVKIASGIRREIMAAALDQARNGRIHILDEMAKALPESRKELSRWAPKITTLQIKQDKIRDLIGPGGKVIRGIQDACDVRIKVEDSGRVDVASSDPLKTEKAIQMIREITQEAEIGALYVGVVKRIADFGAFVEIFPGTDGLIHISHLAKERVERVTDVVNEGDEVLVRVIDIDKAGKIRLSRKDALESLGAN
ncbi:MAG: polyribonucleotide nucleotidyltransferase [Deltaproteobacteria bacterium]|nr:polyribonucleotide nucleotidyltransferase [Deltaproteobacteria bacterium]